MHGETKSALRQEGYVSREGWTVLSNMALLAEGGRGSSSAL